VQPKNFNFSFLVDSGSVVSVLPSSYNFKVQNSFCSKLYAANGSEIKTQGTNFMRIILDNVEYYWNFIVADVPIAIIGADFLAYFDLLIDCKNETLIYRNSKLVNHQIYKRNTDSVINLIKYCPKTKIKTYHNKKKGKHRQQIYQNN